MTISMRQRLAEIKQRVKLTDQSPPHKTVGSRRETIAVMSPAPVLSSDSDKEGEDDGNEEEEVPEQVTEIAIPFGRSLSFWEMKRGKETSTLQRSDTTMCKAPRQRGRWSQPAGNLEMTVKSMLDLRQLESYSVSRTPSRDSLNEVLSGEEGGVLETTPAIHISTAGATLAPRENQPYARPRVIRLMSCEEVKVGHELETPEIEPCPIFPLHPEEQLLEIGSEYQVKAIPQGNRGREYQSNGCPDKHSPDSACSMDYASSHLSSPEHPNEDSESTEPLSVDGISSDLEEPVEEEEDTGSSLLENQMPTTPDQESFLKQHFENLSSNGFEEGPRGSVDLNETVTISSRFLASSQRDQSRSSTNLNQEPMPYPEGWVLPKDLTTTGDESQENGIGELNLIPAYVNSSKKISHERKELPNPQVGDNFTGGFGRGVLPFPVDHVVGGMRKTQSVQDLVHEDDKLGSPVKPRPHPLTEKEPKNSPRRTLPNTYLKADNTGAGNQAFKVPKARSYMNPTTSSMAKMSRSVSMGENLNLSDGLESSTGVDDKSNNPQVSEKVSGAQLVEDDRSKLTGKENVLLKPSLQPATNCSAPKAFQGKLSSANRAHLTLDIPRSLPDRPVFASFSPTCRVKAPFNLEAPRSPAGTCKAKLSFPDTSRACKSETQSPRSMAKNSSLENTSCRTDQPEEPADDSLKLKDFPESPVLANTETIVCKSRGRSSSIGHTVDYDPGLCPVDPVRPRSPSFTSDFTQDSEESVSLEQCELANFELRNSLRRALRLYRSVTTSGPESNTDKGKMTDLLTETFCFVKKELDTVVVGGEPPCGPEEVLQKASESVLMQLGDVNSAVLTSPRRLGDEKTLALLQQYSELLLQAVERRMDKKL